MSSASFVNREDLTPRTANGHVHAIAPVVVFAATFLLLSILVWIIGISVYRLRTGRWRPGRTMIISAFGSAFVLSLALLFILLGRSSLTEFAWLTAIVGTVLVITFLGAVSGGRMLIRRLPYERRWQKNVLSVIVILVVVVGQVYLSIQVTNLPVPRWPAVDPSTAGTLRTTAADLATFLLEVAEPKYLSADVAAQMRTSQVRLASDLSWGLGPGIQHSTQGDALWQWGQHVDFQSVMIIYPQHRFGVVVCTNNDLLNPDVAIRIAHRALGGNIESIRRASHLQFNYRPPT
jgi:multisubunit Na+/H+ antiporter MnhF subunit